MIHLFVYGTLKRGRRNHHLLEQQTYLQEAVTEPVYRLCDCGSYPALVEVAEGGRAIRGEIFLVDEALIPRLDRLEGAPRLFQLQPLRTRDVSFPVLGYLYQRDARRLPDCGESW